MSTVKFHDVNYIEAEYFQLPVTDLSIRYMVRLIKPMEMILDEEIHQIYHQAGSEENMMQKLKDSILHRWRTNYIFALQGEDKFKDEGRLKELIQITDVRLHEVELRRVDGD